MDIYKGILRRVQTPFGHFTRPTKAVNLLVTTDFFIIFFFIVSQKYLLTLISKHLQMYSQQQFELYAFVRILLLNQRTRSANV